MEHFTPWTALIGGGLIGLSASLLMWLNGRVAGISGIFEGLFQGPRAELAWRAMFVLGLGVGGALAFGVSPESFAGGPTKAPWVWLLGGLLVGFGSRLGSGCTSGHGVCGLSRLSVRSAISVPTFITSGAIVVWWVGN